MTGKEQSRTLLQMDKKYDGLPVILLNECKDMVIGNLYDSFQISLLLVPLAAYKFTHLAS